MFLTLRHHATPALLCTILCATLPDVAAAQEPAPAPEAPAEQQRRVRVGIGPQIVPNYPGADSVSIRPFFELTIARGDAEFEFEAADESAGLPLFRSNGFAIGPAFGFQGSRTGEDVGVPLAKVKTTFEAGGFVQYQFAAPLRVRAEARRGIGGHDGWTGIVSADYIARDGDDWLFSVGPRVTLSNDRYHRAYFGVSPADALRSGLPGYRPGGGLQAVGVAGGLIHQFTPKWGIYSYAKYDRLVEDASRSPIVRRFGSRNQFSGGVALTYTFGMNR